MNKIICLLFYLHVHIVIANDTENIINVHKCRHPKPIFYAKNRPAIQINGGVNVRGGQ